MFHEAGLNGIRGIDMGMSPGPQAIQFRRWCATVGRRALRKACRAHRPA